MVRLQFAPQHHARAAIAFAAAFFGPFQLQIVAENIEQHRARGQLKRFGSVIYNGLNHRHARVFSDKDSVDSVTYFMYTRILNRKYLNSFTLASSDGFNATIR
jgi:uncharacterized protein YlbG (UPF0298 family)